MRRIIIDSPTFLPEVRLNAPRQGLYAALLATSFALHAALMVQGAAHQLEITRDAQGELTRSQLVAEAQVGLSTSDTVALALLATRYGDRPDVASLRILDAKQRVLASGGTAPTRDGARFSAPVRVDQQVVGSVELTLIEPSRGEIIRNQWLPLLLSLFLHVFLWLLYRVLARPKAQASLQTPAQTHMPVESAAHVPAMDGLNASPSAASAVSSAAAQVAASAPASVPERQDPLVLRIGFDDPRQLLETLSSGVADPYFLLCQTLLDQSILTLNRMATDPVPQCHMLSGFSAEGARIGLSGASEQHMAEYAMALASLFNVLAEVVYRRHREQKHFALHCRIAIAAAQPDHTARALADRLLKHVKSNGVVLHVNEDVLTRLLHHCALSALPHPVDSQMREAMVLDGLGAEHARRIMQARNRILDGRSDA